jgi:hypothetical protein
VQLGVANIKKINNLRLLNSTLLFVISAILPAFAADSSTSSQPQAMQTIDSGSAAPLTESGTPGTEAQPDKTTEPETQSSEPAALPGQSVKKDIGEKAGQFVAHLPQRLGLFTANVVVAAPATFVRRSAQYTASNTKELIGDHKNPVLLVPAGTLSLYYGLTSGLVEGTTFGIINSWKHSADGHISKASLGLEEDKK